MDFQTMYHTTDEDDDALSIQSQNTQQTVVVDSMVGASKNCSSWIVDSCGMCTGYMDKQVQYEMMAQRFQDTANSLKSSGTTFDIQKAVASCQSNFDDIKATAAMMFDEESVVESVDVRQ
mmetsp:Transcript_5904/g.12821  ORF Transcript_5904/g.12821 Transcript_5904/m.12821 type:complete len:120 (+) Transcript_5904:214-573(+)|eukprot:CAMPEP_0168162904 /NCGR_PEP_ID=MMETSP0139_2-20121125/80_1 /TAXON_ID=44445 /ORGANISM="Pseudo-nitzschia australis, Strain 10249 10 AB" /LENGTH=119 /DNA_ID=CAMNT_0008079741 /DNA_START=206 /DNA_END=565 /DNA_ORIENTATION=+